VEVLGLGILPLVSQGDRELFVARGGEGVGLTQRLQPDGQGLAMEVLGLGVLPLVSQGDREVVVAPGGGGVAFTQPSTVDLEHDASRGFRLGILPSPVRDYELVHELSHCRHRFAPFFG
jgi:hypothetical protein